MHMRTVVGTAEPSHELSLLARLAQWCVRRPWLVVGAWVASLAVGGLAAVSIGGEPTSDVDLPSSESHQAFELLQERFPEQSGDPIFVVFDARGDVSLDERPASAAVDRTVERLRDIPGVRSVLSPLESPGQLDPDRRIGFAVAQLEGQAFDAPGGTLDEFFAVAEEADTPHVQVEAGGRALQFVSREPPGSAEVVGLVVAALVLLLTFGSLVAMGLPLVTGGCGAAAGVLLVLLGSNVVSIPDFGPQLVLIFGLGVGIDYALFLLTRFREGLHRGLDVDDAVIRAVDTAGRAVLFAGSTVIVSLMGLLLLGVTLVRGIALGTATGIALTMLAALTLLPAVLKLLGHRVDSLRVFGKKGPAAAPGDLTGSRWFRWSRVVQRHPVVATLVSIALLVTLALPFLSIELGSPDASSEPTSRTTRRAYDLLTEGFGPGINGPLAVVVTTDSGPLPALDGLTSALNETEGVAIAAPAAVNEAGDTAVIAVIPTTGPQDPATSELIQRLRDDVVPGAGPAGTTRVVGGVTAVFDDLTAFMNERLPVFLTVVLALSFVLLVIVFRSLLVPLKAVLMNLLTIGAAYGVLVAVFQWGWGASLIGLDSTGPIQPFLPMMLFAIVFGLSMDYEVFLISRMSEEYHRHGDNSRAVADGVASTARVITAAAAIMITVFASFLANDDPLLQMFGMGLAVAILLDATVVRVVLVPATMELMGRANWWLPGWLDRRLPTLHLDVGDEEVDEGEPPSPPSTPEAEPTPTAVNGKQRPRQDSNLRHTV